MTQPANLYPIQVPLTTGVVRSFGHLRLTVAGLEFTGGFKQAKLSRKREREMVMSNSPDPVGKTLGENKYSASLIVFSDWWRNTIAIIQTQIGPGYGDQPFNVYLSQVGVNLPVYTDSILNCTLDSSEIDWGSGITALTVGMDLNPTKILFNGLDDLAVPLTSPPQ